MDNKFVLIKFPEAEMELSGYTNANYTMDITINESQFNGWDKYAKVRLKPENARQAKEFAAMINEWADEALSLKMDPYTGEVRPYPNG
jgi:hypothetical protein